MGQLTPAQGSRLPGAALPTAVAGAGDVPAQYLTFSLAGEMFAVGILNVKEIIEFGHLTEVPMMPAFIRGVINLRGAVVPVIDLAARFGAKPTEVARRTCIVILEIGENGRSSVTGVVVDQVRRVIDLSPGDIEPPPSFGNQFRFDFVSGVGKIGGRFVLILEMARILAPGELAELDAEAS